MKFKYYLRGFGTGVLFATVLLIIAINIKDNMPADSADHQEETGSSNILKITSEGEEGTEEDEKSIDKESSDSENEETTGKESSDSRDKETTDQETSNPGEGETTDLSENQTIAETTVAEDHTIETDNSDNNVPSETQSETIAETTQEQAVVEPSGVGGQNTVIEVTISSGMNSADAARVLAASGLIDDEYAFDEYMQNNGFDSKLRIGVYQITKGASYEEVARAITR